MFEHPVSTMEFVLKQCPKTPVTIGSFFVNCYDDDFMSIIGAFGANDFNMLAI